MKNLKNVGRRAVTVLIGVGAGTAVWKFALQGINPAERLMGALVTFGIFVIAGHWIFKGEYMGE